MGVDYKADCPDYLLDYLVYVGSVASRSKRTVEAYYLDLRVFLRYLRIIHNDIDTSTPFDEITISSVPFEYIRSFELSDAYLYMNYLTVERHNSNKTRARKTSSLKKFFNYLYIKKSLLSVNPLEHLEGPKLGKPLPKFLDLGQSVSLLESIDGANKVRDYCIITLFLNCGMRLSELAGLNLSSYSKGSRTLRVVGKGNKDRILYLNDACVKALEDYLKVRPRDSVDKNAVFLSSRLRTHPRMSTRRIQQVVEEQLRRAGLGNLGISVHKLRHTCATLLYEYGNVDLLVLRDTLGHENLSTTEIYTHLSDADRRRAANASPLSGERLADSQGSSQDGGTKAESPDISDNNES